MVYTPVTFGYREQVPSAKLNQLADNDATFETFRAARQALPHMRVRHTIGSLVGASGWTTVPMNTTPADGGTSPQPWTIGSTAITVTETGLYLITSATSGTIPNFNVRILNTNPEPDVTLGQAPGAPSGFQNRTVSLTLSRRLTAGSTIVWQVFGEGTSFNLSGDAAATPCYLDVTRLSD